MVAPLAPLAPVGSGAYAIVCRTRMQCVLHFCRSNFVNMLQASCCTVSLFGMRPEKLPNEYIIFYVTHTHTHRCIVSHLVPDCMGHIARFHGTHTRGPRLSRFQVKIRCARLTRHCCPPTPALYRVSTSNAAPLTVTARPTGQESPPRGGCSGAPPPHRAAGVQGLRRRRRRSGERLDSGALRLPQRVTDRINSQLVASLFVQKGAY